MKPRLFVFLLAHTLCLTFAFAQTSDSVLYVKEYKVIKAPSIGLGMTGNTYVGDLSDNYMKFNRIYPGFNLSLQSNLRNKGFLQPQLNVGYGAVAEQADSFPYLNVQNPNVKYITYIYTPFYYGDARLRLRLFNKTWFRPYLSSGVGLYLFSPQDADGNLLVEAPKTRPRNEVYNTYALNIPLSVGFDVSLNKLVGLGIAYTYRNIFTDYTDNISQLGRREGNDQVHQLQLSMYVSPAPVVVRQKPIQIYIPPEDTAKLDTQILAYQPTKPKRNKRKPQDEIPASDTAAVLYQPRPLDSLLVWLLDTTPVSGVRTKVSDRLLSDTTTIYLDSALSVQGNTNIFAAKRRYNVQKVYEFEGDSLESVVGETTEMLDELKYAYKEVQMLQTKVERADSVDVIYTDTLVVRLWRALVQGQADSGVLEAKLDSLVAAAIANQTYVYYEVKKWDKWEDIEQKFKVKKDKILKVNALQNEKLIGGTVLRVPKLLTEEVEMREVDEQRYRRQQLALECLKNGGGSSLCAELQAQTQRAIEQQRFVYYEVKKWDKWEDIELRFAVPRAVIMRLNQMSQNKLMPQSVLRIPDVDF